MKSEIGKGEADVVREAVVAVLGRDRHGGAPTLDRVVGAAAGGLLASNPLSGPLRTLRAAEDLARRGDPAGARLLLRAVARVSPHRDLREAAVRLRPAGATRRRVGVFALVMLAAGLLAAGVVAAVDAGADAVAFGLLAGSVGPVLAVRVAWVRHVPLVGLTLQESQFWRSLGVLRRGDFNELSLLGDGRLRRATDSVRSSRAQRHPSDAERFNIAGWVGMAGVVGSVLCLVAGLAIPDLPAGTFLVLMPVGAVFAALATRILIFKGRPAPGSRSPHDRGVSEVPRDRQGYPRPR